MTTTRSGRQCGGLIIAAIAALTLTSCTGNAEEGGDHRGTGVSYGASMEEYRAAFADVEPITLRIQVEGPQGDPANLGRQAWIDAIQDWSDGKVEFEIGYSNSFVPSPLEFAPALADGRLDVALFVASYQPEVFPLGSGLADTLFLDGSKPITTLATSGWIAEIMATDQRFVDEALAAGVRPLGGAPLPLWNLTGLYCTSERTSLDELRDGAVSVTGSGRVAQTTALGMLPQSIVFAELYEAVQRGIVDCAATNQGAIGSAGLTTSLPHVTLDPDAALTASAVFLGVSEETWQSLPLVAQQLLYDRIDVLLTQTALAESERFVDVLTEAVDAGGGVSPYAADARRVLQETNDQLLDELAANGHDTDSYAASSQAWAQWLTAAYPELPADVLTYIDGGPTYDTIDLQRFIDHLFAEVLLGGRPG